AASSPLPARESAWVGCWIPSPRRGEGEGEGTGRLLDSLSPQGRGLGRGLGSAVGFRLPAGERVRERGRRWEIPPPVPAGSCPGRLRSAGLPRRGNAGPRRSRLGIRGIRW